MSVPSKVAAGVVITVTFAGVKFCGASTFGAAVAAGGAPVLVASVGAMYVVHKASGVLQGVYTKHQQTIAERNRGGKVVACFPDGRVEVLTPQMSQGEDDGDEGYDIVSIEEENEAKKAHTVVHGPPLKKGWF